jgi:orotate phosphoribosyltransferase
MSNIEEYKKELAITLAETGALFFDQNLILKDGRPTPYFLNFGMFRTGQLSMDLGSHFAAMMVEQGLAEKTDIILGPSYKGSAIALAATIALSVNHGTDLLFEYDRKEAKTHGEGSQAGSLFVNKTFYDGCRVLIVDDVATSMSTKVELIEKVQAEAQAQKIRIEIVGIGIAVDREQTTAVYDKAGKVVLNQKGENTIENFQRTTGIPVYAVARVRELIEFLHAEKIPVLIEGRKRLIDAEIKARFDEYLRIYGV